jgi:hypothetical protein
MGLSFGVPWFVLSWIDLFSSSSSAVLVSLSTVLLIHFYALTATIILLFILRSPRVHEDIIYGAISVYLLIGGAWSSIYSLLETAHPGSFSVVAAQSVGKAMNWADFLYFSFATLTTLGYGDIVPVTSQARSLAVVEAVIGVMYLAVIISRLVGLFIAHSTQRESSSP